MKDVDSSKGIQLQGSHDLLLLRGLLLAEDSLLYLLINTTIIGPDKQGQYSDSVDLEVLAGQKRIDKISGFLIVGEVEDTYHQPCVQCNEGDD